MSAARFLPLVVGLILAGAVVATAVYYVPSSSYGGTQNTVLRVGYPDSLDESDVSDLYAYNNILPAQGITVYPTFYDAPFLSYQGLVAGQQDIALVSGSSLFSGVANSGQHSTFVSCYALGGTFLMIAGYGITSLAQLKGGAIDDFGQGSQTRALNLFWLSQASVPANTAGLNTSSVYLRPSGPNPTRLYDLEHAIGGVKAITVDDFLLPAAQADNDTAHNGPFHVLAYAPANVAEVCYAVQDSWLQSKSNQAVLIKWIAAIIQAQRAFITNPSLMQTFTQAQLPVTDPKEIQFASTFYPQHWTYWPYGWLSLQGSLNVQNIFTASNSFYVVSQSISSPLSNSSGGPFGLFNAGFEKAALQSLGPFTYPCHSWVTSTFAAQVNAVVPSSQGSVPANCSTASTAGPVAGSLSLGPLLTTFFMAVPGVRPKTDLGA